MATIRILQSLATLDRGGAEAVIMNIYRNIDRSKIQFDFVVNDWSKPYAFEAEVKQLGGRVFKVPKFNGKNLFHYRKQFKKLFREHPEWSIVHIHNSSSAMLFLDIAKDYQLSTIVHAHFDHGAYDFKTLVQQILRTPIKMNADYLLACSKRAGANVFKIKEEEVAVVRNAIETNKYIFNEDIRKNKRKELGLKYEMVIGHVGRMDEQKNHSYLIDIFKVFHERNPNSVLLLIGDGELRETLQMKAINEGLSEKIRFLGVRSDVNELLQAMDIFILPSVTEGLPVTLIEAQAAGLPILAADSITREVVITDLITFKNIELAPGKWADEIDDHYLIYREDQTQALVDAGYDAKAVANDLLKYYTAIIKGGD